MGAFSFGPGHPAHLVLGLVVWSLWFVLLYGGLSVACALVPPESSQGAWNWLNGTMLVLALVFAGGLLMGAWSNWRHAPSADDGKVRQRFLCRTAAAVYLFAALASLAISLPALLLPPCT